MTRTIVFTAALSLCACASAPKNILGDSEMAKKFAPVAFLVGDWDGSGTTASSGSGSTGSFSLAPDLQTHVLSRRGFNMNGPQLHEDLTIIYTQGADLRADSWDNEGHNIRYQIFPQPQTKQVVFESNPLPDGTQYRVTYRSIDDDTVQMKLDIGHAGGDYQPSIDGTLKRRKK